MKMLKRHPGEGLIEYILILVIGTIVVIYSIGLALTTIAIIIMLMLLSMGGLT